MADLDDSGTQEVSDSGLFAISVDTDDYADAAAEDTPDVPRTYQSEADFQAVKAGYAAKVHGAVDADADGGENAPLTDLYLAVPDLEPSSGPKAEGTAGENGGGAVSRGGGEMKLSKKDVQLLGYAIGYLYYERRYVEILELCARVKQQCEVDPKTQGSVARWEGRCRLRLGLVDGNGDGRRKYDHRNRGD